MGKTQSSTPTQMPADPTQLWVSKGNLESDTVIIYAQGGPKSYLYIERDGKTNLRYLPNIKNYHSVHLHQAQTYNIAFYNYEGEFSMERAKHEVNITSDFLYQSIKHFKAKGKYVVVIGFSYGAYLTLHYLSRYPDLAGAYFVISGRVDDPVEMIKDHRKGENGAFAADGTTYIPPVPEDPSKYSEAENKEYYAKNRLKAAIAEQPFSELLKAKDLSKLTFFYATNDENVGSLNEKEVKFLEKHKAKVFETKEGHVYAFYRFVDRMRDGSISY